MRTTTMSAPASSSSSSPLDQPRRVGPPVAGAAGAGGDQVGIGRRQQQDGRLGHLPFVPQRRYSCGTDVEVGELGLAQQLASGVEGRGGLSYALQPVHFPAHERILEVAIARRRVEARSGARAPRMASAKACAAPTNQFDVLAGGTATAADVANNTCCSVMKTVRLVRSDFDGIQRSRVPLTSPSFEFLLAVFDVVQTTGVRCQERTAGHLRQARVAHYPIPR